jgi:FixJ family two-component response regulator
VTRPGHGHLVAVVDDDVSVRESLPEILRELGYASIAFASAEEVLSSLDFALVQCLVLDVGLPGISGPQLRQQIMSGGRSIPTVFITGRPEWALPLALGKQRAVQSLLKPFGAHELRSALDAVLLARD